MSNILGTLLLELGINSSAFKSGLDAATYQAKQFSNELKSSLSQVQGSVANLASAFGELNPAVSGAMQGILSGLEAVGRSTGPIGAALAVLAAEFVVVGGATIGFTLKAAEAAEKLHSLSQATGVSVETLSALGRIAKINGIEIDQLAKGLERLDKSAFAAASAGTHARNAYRELGIAVVDSQGHMRGTSAIFEDVANKFNTMKDGAEKTALAISIFGREGAAFIPTLNRGGNEIAVMAEHLKKMGAVMTDDVADASAKLEENMALLSGAFAGVSNRLLKDLVPALSELVNELVAGLEDSQSNISVFVSGLADVAKIIINVVQTAVEAVRLLSLSFRLASQEGANLGNTIENVYRDLKAGDVKGAFGNLKDGAVAAGKNVKDTFSEAFDSIKSTFDKMGSVWTGTIPKRASKSGTSGGGGARPNVDFVNEAVRAFEREADKAAEAANAIGKLSAATIEASATAESNAAIQRLQDEAWKKGIENTTAFKNALAAAIPKLQEAALWQQTFKAALEIQKEFDKFDDAIDRQIAALDEEAKSSNVVEKQWARNEAVLTPLSKHLAELVVEWGRLTDAERSSAKGLELSDKILALEEQLANARDKVDDLNKAFQSSKATEETNKLTAEIKKLGFELENIKHGDAFLNVAEQADYLEKVVGLAHEQVLAIIPDLEKIRQLQIQKELGKVQAGLGFDDNKLNTIKAEMDALNASGQSGDKFNQTMAELNKEMADLQAKTGGLGSGIKAAFADLATQAKSSGEIIHETLGVAFQGIANNFADMAATGKAHWKDLINSMEQMLIKSAINTLLAKIAGALGGAGGAGGSGGGFSGILGSILGGLGHKAMGGDVSPGKSYIVGENGPEVFQPDFSGTIIPNGSSSGMGASVTQNMYINTPNADSFQRSKSQIESEMFRAAANSHSRMR